MTTSQVNSWSAFKYQLRVWKIFGILSPPRESPWYIPYNMGMVFISVTTSIAVFLTLLIYCCTTDDFQNAYESLYVVNSVGLIIFKFVNLYMLRSDLLSMRPILDKLDARAVKEEEIQVLQKAIDDTRSFFLRFLTIMSIAMSAAALSVFYSPTKKLIFPAWYPWDWKKSDLNFFLAAGHQMYAFTGVVIQETANSVYPHAYLNIFTAHIRALKIRILQINKQDGKINQITHSSNKNEIVVYHEITNCIKDHLTILELFKIMQKVLSLHSFMQFFNAGFSLGTMAVFLSKEINDYSRVITIFLHFATVTGQIYILCDAGETFSQEYEDLSRAIYACNWIGQSQPFQKTLIVMLAQSQRPHMIMAANFIPVGLPTFLRVMRLTYTLFTVMNKMSK